MPRQDIRKPKTAEIELGLAVSGATLPKGEARSLTEMAQFCGCSRQAIHSIYESAIRKVRRKLAEQGLQSLSDLIEHEERSCQ